jgi:hypothetical protein
MLLRRQDRDTYRNKQVRHQPLILLPCLSIPLTTAFDVAKCSMHNHTTEEEGIKPWEWRPEACHCCPGQGEEKIAGVVDFPGIAI